MDRLQALIARSVVCATVSMGFAGCDDTQPPPVAPGGPASRFNAVPAARPRNDAVQAFCDQSFAPGAGPVFTAPPLAEGSLGTVRGWRWVNLWATWCHPCLEEIPLLTRWSGRLGAPTAPLTVEFVSADSASEDVQGFVRTHPRTPVGARLTTPDAMAPWLAGVGMRQAGSLPIHVIVGPDNRVRCVRAGAVSDSDQDTVRALLSGG